MASTDLFSQISSVGIEDEEEVFAENIGNVCHVVNSVEAKTETANLSLGLLLL